MKFYALTYVNFDQSKGFTASLQSNLLLFTDKYDIIMATKQAQKESIIRHLTETHGKAIQTQETVPTCEATIYNTCITAGSTVHLLIINTVEAIPKSTNEPITPGDFVTLTAAGIEAIQSMETTSAYRGAPSCMKLAKVLKTETEQIEIMICAVKLLNNGSTEYMGQKYRIPKDFIKKVYI